MYTPANFFLRSSFLVLRSSSARYSTITTDVTKNTPKDVVVNGGMGQSVEGVDAPPLPTVASTCPGGSTGLTGEGLGWCNNNGKIKFNDAYKGRGYDGPGGFVCQSPDWSSIGQNDLFQAVTVEASTNYQITYEVKPRYYAAPMRRTSRASNGGVYVWFGDTMPALDKNMHNTADFWMYVT